MPIPIYLVDAFVDQPFSGNPAGVCLLHQSASDAWLQSVAMEMNQAETAFLWAEGDRFRLRWFTPTVEVDLCGHATLASAHLLWEVGRAKPGQAIGFQTRSGLLTCTQEKGMIQMDFPSCPIQETVPLGADWEAALGPWNFTGHNRMDYLIAISSAERVRAWKPDMRLIAQLPCRGLILTAPSDRPGEDFISRFFAPQSGVAEDPVTGSAHCCLAPFWKERLQKSQMIGYQASRRGGVVHVECQKDRVLLRGKARTMLRGELLSQPE